MKNHAISMFFIALLISSSLCSIKLSSVRATDATGMPFIQELDIMFDTGLEGAMFQPVDLRIQFEKPCWALDETTHSVRVAYDQGFGLTEIESQIYDLEFSDESHISACSLVFLIPEGADGTEKYYVCYDNTQTEGTSYSDHVSVEDASYFYEPMTGLLIDIDYYKVTEDGSVLYAIIYNGEVLGISMGHHVYKMKSNSPDFEFENVEQTASFNMEYSADPSGTYLGTHMISDMSKSILVDGNLMVRFNIKIISKQGNIMTDNIYSYYYQPDDAKSLDVKIHHEVLEDIQIKGDTQKDGTYCFLSTFKARSATITSLNIGEIMPKVHVFSEEELVNEYDVPVDPDMYPPSWLIQTSDDIDLGTHAWVSMDDPRTGKCYALLFGANTDLVDDNTDGLQMKLSAAQQVKLPGMEADTCDLIVTRNAYEHGSHRTILEKGFEVICDVRFASFTSGGTGAVDAMSKIYQPAVAKRPVSWSNISEEPQIEEKKYSLTVFVKNAVSPPMGPLLAIVTGKKIPYIYAEVYQEGKITSSSSASRLPLGNLNIEFENTNLFDKITMIVGLFDWRNISFFKKCVFPALEAGTYVVKIFKENPLFTKERQYIGFGIIDLHKDDTVKITCRVQGTITISLRDQDKKGIKNAELYLLSDDVVISDDLSDENGYAILYAPCFPLQPYTLRVVYKGFLLMEEEVSLGVIHHFIDVKREGDWNLYDLQLLVKDTWGFPSTVEVNPKLTSNDMFTLVSIIGEKTDDGEYIFRNLIPATYTLSMDYKSFHVERDISLTQNEEMEVIFPAEYHVCFKTMNSYGTIFSNGKIRVSRNTKTQSIDIDEEGKAEVTVPPGKYHISVNSGDRDIAQQSMAVSSEKEIDIITSEDSLLHIVILYLGIILALFSLGYILLKKKITGLKLLAIALIIISLVSPWWVLSGKEGATVTNTKTLLFPPSIVTRTSSDDVSGGEISQIPEDVTLIISIFSILFVIAGLCFFISIFTELKFHRTTIFLITLGIVLLVATVSVFYVMYSMLADFSVGSVIGSGAIEIKIPGDAGSTMLPCTWGFGISFYLGIVTIIIMVLSLVLKKFKVLAV